MTDKLPVKYPRIGLIALVPDEWSEIWQTRHHVLSRLASDFHVVWVNPSSGWRELFRQRRKHSYSGVSTVVGKPGLHVYQPPPTLPKLYRPRIIADLTERIRLRQVRNHLVKLDCQTIVAYLWRPHMAAMLDLLPHDVSVYHIDDEYSFSKSEKPISFEEMSLIAHVDQVFIHSEAMFAKKGHINPASEIIPNGVDYSLWSSSYSAPEDIVEIPRPRVGYIGGIKSQLDFELLLTIAKMHQKMSFVFVGPMGVVGSEAETVRALMELPNVWYLGAKPAKTLPAYAANFDVCTMCYRKDDYTKYISPLKLHEYLATGQPVIGTSIPALLPFAHVIRLADTAQEWSRALNESVEPEAKLSATVEERQKTARQFDWDLLVGKVSKCILKHVSAESQESRLPLS